MKIGIVGPLNPKSLSEWLKEKDVPSINGCATAVNTLAKGLLDEGHELQIFTLSTAVPQRYSVLKGERVTVHIIPIGIMPRLTSFHQLVVGQFYLPQRIAKVIKNHLSEIDVLHAQWTYEYAKAISLLSDRLPVFCTVRDWCPYQLTLMKGRSRIDWLLKYITFEQVMADKRITFIANSNYTHNMITKKYQEKIVPVIPNPIEKKWIIEEFKRPMYKEKELKFLSIASGLCSPRKNIRTLLEAFAKYRCRHNGAELHLVGSYSEHNPLYVEWQKKGLFIGVTMHGSMPHNKIMELLDQMDCLVHPALEETFGNILLEAMSRGVPCIGGSNSGAVPDVLGHGKFGLICNIRDAQSIVETMEKMNESETYHRLQVESINMLRMTYASDVVARKHLTLYHTKIDCMKS